MLLSESTLKLISELKEFSGNKIKNADDLSIIIQASHQIGNRRLLNDLAFTAMYLNGLGRILNKNKISETSKGLTQVKPLDETAAAKIRNEFKEHIKKFSLELTAIIKDLGDIDRKAIELKYLDMTRPAMINLTSLIYDLTWLKKYFNTYEVNKNN